MEYVTDSVLKLVRFNEEIPNKSFSTNRVEIRTFVVGHEQTLASIGAVGMFGVSVVTH